MTNLTQKLKALAEFDLSFANFRSETFANNNASENIKPGHVTLGQEIENARLQPLIVALLECVEALEDISIKIVSPLSMTDARQLLASIEHRSDEVLAKLQALVSEGK